MNIAFGIEGTICSIAIRMNPTVSTDARASQWFTDPKWDMLPYVIHGIIAEPLSTYQGAQKMV